VLAVQLPVPDSRRAEWALHGVACRSFLLPCRRLVFVRFVLVRDRRRFALLTINPCGSYALAASTFFIAGPPLQPPCPTSSAARRGRRQQQELEQEQYWSRNATLSARVVLGRSSPVLSFERGKGGSSSSSPRRATNDSLPSPGAASQHVAVSIPSGSSPTSPPAASTAVTRFPGGTYPFVLLPLLKRSARTRDDRMRTCRARVLSSHAADNKTRLMQILIVVKVLQRPPLGS